MIRPELLPVEIVPRVEALEVVQHVTDLPDGCFLREQDLPAQDRQADDRDLHSTTSSTPSPSCHVCLPPNLPSSAEGASPPTASFSPTNPTGSSPTATARLSAPALPSPKGISRSPGDSFSCHTLRPPSCFRRAEIRLSVAQELLDPRSDVFLEKGVLDDHREEGGIVLQCIEQPRSELRQNGLCRTEDRLGHRTVHLAFVHLLDADAALDRLQGGSHVRRVGRLSLSLKRGRVRL